MRAYKVSPDTASYSWVITAYLALGRVYDATRLLAEMGDAGQCVRVGAFLWLWGVCSVKVAVGRAFL